MATGSPAAVSTQPAPGIERNALRGLVLFSLGHFFVDLYSSTLGVFQPLLIDKLNFSLAEAGLLGGLLSFSASVAQPAYGYLSDRYRTRLFSALAPAVTGIFIAGLGLAPSYSILALMIVLGGVGIASFHPQASSRATLGLHNRAFWMAAFISAGNLGLAFGPVSFSALFRTLGLRGAAWGAAPGILMTILLLALLPDRQPVPDARRSRFDWRPLAVVWQPLTILFLLVFLRSVVQVSFTQFLPLYLSRERGFSIQAASWTLSMYLATGAIGGFLGGRLADRFGGKRIIQISMLGCLPFLGLFFVTGGAVSLAALAAGGLILLFTIPVNVVMAQELVPSQSGTVSALMMGFAWGAAGMIFIPLTGWAADHISLHTTLFAEIALPAAGFLLTFLLREP